ncbi:MAG: hypothetical protein SXU28_04535 [Pseudomonadota bacterium]|nr:hypothetical protein [Pseudomonadota bacterium]
MSRIPDQFHEDRALRDAARAVLMADIEHARVTLSGKGVATRVAGRIGDGAKDVLEVAKTQADDNRGIVAALIGALVLWLARVPILQILGLAPFEDEDEEQETGDEVPVDEQAKTPESDATDADDLDGLGETPGDDDD